MSKPLQEGALHVEQRLRLATHLEIAVYEPEYRALWRDGRRSRWCESLSELALETQLDEPALETAWRAWRVLMRLGTTSHAKRWGRLVVHVEERRELGPRTRPTVRTYWGGLAVLEGVVLATARHSHRSRKAATAELRRRLAHRAEAIPAQIGGLMGQRDAIEDALAKAGAARG
ncbi:MAG: hypothetical protein IT378_14580 [Sandaracinaceae bacterium]|nr:hypothetical protein [Sandaracinaceae bacterium]